LSTDETMARKLLTAIGLMLIVVVVYLLIWPVPVRPVAWQAPVSHGYVGPFARNERLKDLELRRARIVYFATGLPGLGGDSPSPSSKTCRASPTT
jgi:hypothetical protein